MTRLDEQFLKDIGVTNTEGENAQRMIADLAATLQMRVGLIFASKLDDETLQKIDPEQDMTEAWLKEHIPDYEQIVSDELDAMKSELIEERKALIGQN